jgi:hypothetical protein
MSEYAPSPPRDLDKELCQLLSDLHLLHTPQQVTGMMKVTDKPRFLWKHRNTCIQMRLWHTQYRTGEPWLHIVVDKSSRAELAKTIAHTVTRVMKIKVRLSEQVSTALMHTTYRDAETQMHTRQGHLERLQWTY